MDDDKKNYQIKDRIIKEEIFELMNNVRYSNDPGLKFYSRMLLTDYYKTTDVENLFLNYYMMNNGRIKEEILFFL